MGKREEEQKQKPKPIDKQKLFETIQGIEARLNTLAPIGPALAHLEEDVSKLRDAINLVSLRVTALEDWKTERTVDDRKWWRATIDAVIDDVDRIREKLGMPTSGKVEGVPVTTEPKNPFGAEA